MKARSPRIDYSAVRPHWTKNHEFAHHQNATSTIPTYIEPYLIKVMNRAKEALPEREVELRQMIDMFNIQEGQHARQHAVFNRRIREFYPDILPLEMKLKAELETFLETKSLRFNVAYCEGFESMGPPAAKIWFEDSDEYLEGADYEPVAMWKWHMAEEFEHREVCYRVFKRLYARNPFTWIWNGWLYRIYVLRFVLKHLGEYTNEVRKVMVKQDRRNMTPEELAQSRENMGAVIDMLKYKLLPLIKPAFSPFYDPAKKKTPRGMDEYLARFDKGGDMGRDEPVGASA